MLGRIPRNVALWLLASVFAAAQGGPPPPNIRNDSNSLPNAPSAQRNVPADPRPHVQSWWLVSSERAPYRPLTKREKFQSFVHHAYSPYTFVGAAYDATYAQMVGDPYDYGGGTQGWGKRFGAAVAGTEARSFFGTFLFPSLLHQDPRYFALYHGSVKQRALHALKRVVMVRADDGRETFNSSGLLGIAFTESLSIAWAPEGQRSAHTTGMRMLGAMQGDAAGYILREFTPDILRLFKRHAPERLRKIEERMPAQITGDSAASQE
ncbi:MAG: hypothetical protein ACR2IF_15170 [Terriglobales bacterium]